MIRTGRVTAGTGTGSIDAVVVVIAGDDVAGPLVPGSPVPGTTAVVTVANGGSEPSTGTISASSTSALSVATGFTNTTDATATATVANAAATATGRHPDTHLRTGSSSSHEDSAAIAT